MVKQGPIVSCETIGPSTHYFTGKRRKNRSESSDFGAGIGEESFAFFVEVMDVSRETICRCRLGC